MSIFPEIKISYFSHFDGLRVWPKTYKLAITGKHEAHITSKTILSCFSTQTTPIYIPNMPILDKITKSYFFAILAKTIYIYGPEKVDFWPNPTRLNWRLSYGGSRDIY